MDCAREKLNRKRKHNFSGSELVYVPKPPIHRSDTVLFSPPACPEVLESGTEDELDLIDNNTLHYFDFDMSISKKIYKSMQVSISSERIAITSFGTIPPFRALFYRDILAVAQSQINNRIMFIYWFPWVGGSTNSRRTETRIVTKHETAEERNKFYHTMSKFLQCSSGTSFHEQKLRLSKRLLILINPKAGSGNAWNIYLKIAHVFDIAGIQCDSVYLDNTSHAAQILRDANLGTYFAIACCGGDGLMHHTIDTIYRRGINIPTFCIPAGHGVGIAASILAHASPLSAAYSIAKGFRRPLDIMEIKQNGSVMCYSSLLVSWGLVADIEFETAGLRWMGPIRYKMGAIAAITKPPLHHLRISYLPAKSNTMAFCTGGGCKVCSKGAALARENEEKKNSMIAVIIVLMDLRVKKKEVNRLCMKKIGWLKKENLLW